VEKEIISGKIAQFNVMVNNDLAVVVPQPLAKKRKSLLRPCVMVNAATALLDDVDERLKLGGGFKVGGLDFIMTLNHSETMATACQILHLDATSNSNRNLIGCFIAVPIRESFHPQLSRCIHGTEVVDRQTLKYPYRWDEAPYFEIENEAFKFDSPVKRLRISASQYAAIVVNKIPHRGPSIPVKSVRLVMFVYIVPKDWTRSAIDLDVTIPAVHFFFLFNEDDEINCDALVQQPEILKWVQAYPDVWRHWTGNKEQYRRLLKNTSNVTASLKSVAEIDSRRNNKKNSLLIL